LISSGLVFKVMDMSLDVLPGYAWDQVFQAGVPRGPGFWIHTETCMSHFYLRKCISQNCFSNSEKVSP